jgi:spore germination protein YaaH
LFILGAAGCAGDAPPAAPADPQLASVVSPATGETAQADETPRYAVTVWAPYFSVLERQTLADYADVITEINPVWYELAANGDIEGTVQSPIALDEARDLGIRVVPSIANGGFDRERVAAIIHDPERRAQHIDDIVTLALENDFDGVDIDYESLFPEDRDAFSRFIEELAQALHGEGKLLSIAVHAKTDDQGAWSGPQAQDWVRLGAAADEFKIMTYDFHYGTSEAGPIAPLGWVDEVLTYAASRVPPEKTFMGVHFYGYDWVGSSGESIDWRQAMKRAKTNDAVIQRDESGEAWFTYGPDGRNTVYFADAQSLDIRLTTLLDRHPDLAGVAIWRLGSEDPGNWEVLGDNVARGQDEGVIG